jgi:hypothetical protein
VARLASGFPHIESLLRRLVSRFRGHFSIRLRTYAGVLLCVSASFSRPFFRPLLCDLAILGTNPRLAQRWPKNSWGGGRVGGNSFIAGGPIGLALAGRAPDLEGAPEGPGMRKHGRESREGRDGITRRKLHRPSDWQIARRQSLGVARSAAGRTGLHSDQRISQTSDFCAGHGYVELLEFVPPGSTAGARAISYFWILSLNP